MRACYGHYLPCHNTSIPASSISHTFSNICLIKCFPPWLYSPILGHGRLHETFRFNSVTRSRTLGWTPWTGDQLVARPLLTAPGDCDDGEVGGVNRFWQAKPKYSDKTCTDATLSTTNPTCQNRVRVRAEAVGSQRLTASAMARPAH
jgi:hypothetical protein